jgi:hypothetical protein
MVRHEAALDGHETKLVGSSQGHVEVGMRD